MNSAVKQKIGNSLRIYFVNKYPRQGSATAMGCPMSNDEFYNFQKNFMEIFYGLDYGFNDQDGFYYKKNDILKKEDVADYLVNIDNYSDEGKEACIVFDCVYKI